MRIDFYIAESEARRFKSSCEAVIRNVGRGTKTATTQACTEILQESLKQVPRKTGTLASTGFYEVRRRTNVKGYNYEGIIGYAGMAGSGVSHDRVNPVTGKPASSYSAVVHEDLAMVHRNGKAKFLEDPVREYGARNFKRVAETAWRYAIESTDAGGTMIIPQEV